ncbi:MAG: diphthamide synthesis protein, partial [Nanoarchaeota archaeon]|nr:diphthamide synthesis protein [Nanoarchaeota archaeon]
MFDKERIIGELKKLGAKRVLIQAPEGLKTKLHEFIQELEGQGLVVFASCDPCFGACDLADTEAKQIDCVLLHIGHTDFGVKPKVPVIYEPYNIDADPIPLIKKHEECIKKHKSICLVTTSQFLGVIEPAKNYLESLGIQVLLHKQTRSGKQGHILGCDYSAALPLENDVDCFLYIGSGIFHPLGLALKTEKHVLSLNLETGELDDMTDKKNKLQRIKAYNIGVAQDADKFGILLTTKP